MPDPQPIDGSGIPSILSDPEQLAQLTADEALALRHIMDKLKEQKQAREAARAARAPAEFLDNLDEELACRFGMNKTCIGCDD